MPAINDTNTKTQQLSHRKPNKHVLPGLSIKRPTQMHVSGAQIEAAINSVVLVESRLHIICRASIQHFYTSVWQHVFVKRLVVLLLWMIIAFKTIMKLLISMVYPVSNLFVCNGGSILSVIIIGVLVDLYCVC